MLNTDVKILSKVMAQRLKNTLPFLISANQSAYVDGRFISKEIFFISQKEKELHRDYIIKRTSMIAILSGKISTY